MKSIVFDAGPIISLTTTNLLWILEKLKENYDCKLLIADAVKKELVDRPLSSKKFKFEALQVLRCIKEDVINVISSDETKQKTLEILEIANNCFKAKGNPIRIVHYGEISGIACCLALKADAFAVDERTTRLLIENPKRLAYILSHKLHTRIETDAKKVNIFRNLTKGIRIIRSTELVTIAYEFGLLNDYIADIENPKENLLDSVLWGVKLNGCSISRSEIEQILRLERRR